MSEPILSGHRAGDERERTARKRNPGGLVKLATGMSERGDHQAVPVGENLVVASWPDALRAQTEKLGPKACQALFVGVLGIKTQRPVGQAGENRMAFEIATRRDVVVAGEERRIRRPQGLLDGVERP